MGIGGFYVVDTDIIFLSYRSQHVMRDGCWSKLFNVVSGVPQGCVLLPLLFLLCTSELFSIQENNQIGYSDDCSYAIPSIRVAVAEAMIHDLGRVSE